MRTSTILCFHRCSAAIVQTRTVIDLTLGHSVVEPTIYCCRTIARTYVSGDMKRHAWAFQAIYTKEYRRVTSEDVRLPSPSARGVFSMRSFRSLSNLNMKPSTGLRHALSSPELSVLIFTAT